MLRSGACTCTKSPLPPTCAGSCTFLEANYVREDNLKIRNAMEKLRRDLVKTYRVYEKPIE